MLGKILVINPGSTSTKVALCEEDLFYFQDNIEHPQKELEKFELVTEQYEYRKQVIEQVLQERTAADLKLAAVVGRCGPLAPMEGGTYLINEKMLEDHKSCIFANHPSNLGSILAVEFAKKYNCPAFIVDPITTDEFDPRARISGFPGIERTSRSHALNIKATARAAALNLGINFNEVNFVVCHMGGGISICPVRKGRIIDANNALLGQGPYSPERAGSLPIGDIVELCFSGKMTKNEIIKAFSKQAGLKGYLGTADCREVEERIANGDEQAKLIYDAMIYQIVYNIGGCVAVLKGELEAIIITGGMANSPYLVRQIKEHLEKIAKILIYPGEMEMEAMAKGAIRVLKGLEEPKEY